MTFLYFQIVPYSDDMPFFERLSNTVISIGDWFIRRFIHLPTQDVIAQKYFGHLGKLPSMDDLIKNVSVTLINTHQSILPPRPSFPGIAFIGGAYIKVDD